MNEEPLWILCALDWGQNRKYYYPLGPEGILQNCISQVIYGGFIPRNLQESYDVILRDHKIYVFTNFYMYKRWKPIWCALGT